MEVEGNVEDHGVGHHCAEEVLEDETGVGIVGNELQGHDGKKDAGLDPDEEWEADAEDGEGGDNNRVGPVVNIPS